MRSSPTTSYTVVQPSQQQADRQNGRKSLHHLAAFSTESSSNNSSRASAKGNPPTRTRLPSIPSAAAPDAAWPVSVGPPSLPSASHSGDAWAEKSKKRRPRFDVKSFPFFSSCRVYFLRCSRETDTIMTAVAEDPSS